MKDYIYKNHTSILSNLLLINLIIFIVLYLDKS